MKLTHNSMKGLRKRLKIHYDFLELKHVVDLPINLH